MIYSEKAKLEWHTNRRILEKFKSARQSCRTSAGEVEVGRGGRSVALQVGSQFNLQTITISIDYWRINRGKEVRQGELLIPLEL